MKQSKDGKENPSHSIMIIWNDARKFWNWVSHFSSFLHFTIITVEVNSGWLGDFSPVISMAKSGPIKLNSPIFYLLSNVQ